MLRTLPKLSIAVLGSGPRALASAICLSRHHSVWLGEVGAYRAQKRLARLPMYPGESKLDELMQRSFADIKFTDSYSSALAEANLVIIAEQPLFRPVERSFDLSAIERCIETVARRRPRAIVILEAPTPVGFAKRASLQNRLQVIPAPLLLRQGNVARDRVQPQRIVVGATCETGLTYAFIAVRSCRDPNTPYVLTNSCEAEAIHAFERWRVLRGRTETSKELVDYCEHRRLNQDQVLRGLQPIDHVSESQLCTLGS